MLHKKIYIIGDQFSESNLTTKRSGIYIAASNWDKIIKKRSKISKQTRQLRLKFFINYNVIWITTNLNPFHDIFNNHYLL